MIYPVVMYTAKCDGCGKEEKLMGEYYALESADSVEQCLLSSEYCIIDGKHYCHRCWTYNDDDCIVLLNEKQDENDV